MTEPTNGTSDRQPDDATREIPQDQTAAIPSAYAYPAPPPISESAAAESASTESASTESAPIGTPLTDEPAPRERRRTGLIIGTVAAVAVLGTGGVLAYNALSGGGAQPAEALPSDTYFYARLDIDPSAGQKISAVRFLNKIPELKDLGSGDARKTLWELATRDADDECVTRLDYDKEIAPWIGERAGVALRPGGTAEMPNVALALQVTDEAGATATLNKLFACSDDEKPDLRMKNGYALITNPGKGDDLIAAVDKGTLAGNATFTGDMAALGDEGVLSLWGDLSPLLKDATNMAPDAAAESGIDADQVTGRVAAALRFDPAFVELAGIARGVKGPGTVLPTPGGDSTALTKLPGDTMIAAHVANGDKALDAAWPDLKKQLDEFAASEGQDDMLAMVEDQFGIKLPGDLKAILGSSFTFAMPEQDFEDDMPTLGLKIVSNDAARAEEVLTNVEDLAGSSLLTKEVDGDRLYVATTPDYVTRLKSDGNLGDSEAFKTALGDLSSIQFAYFMDLDKLEKLYLEETEGDARTALEALRAMGFSASGTGAGDGTFSLRVVGN